MLKKILLIDDEPHWPELLKARLEADYRILMAFDGEAGIRVAREEKPDLIFCDLMMPLVDGYRVVHELKRDPETRHIPIFLLTANINTNSILKAQQIGVTDYLTKPLNLEELPRFVRKFI
ncbi:MAG: response regulator [Candidatus Omnitrophica bacterium]|nr:response regulator [Candidatus Omnitrophota bacterium]